MTDEKKAELRALLKPGSPEPSDEQYEILSAFWDECVRRYCAATSIIPGPDHAVVDPREVRQEILESASALGLEPYDPARHGEIKVIVVR